MTPYTCLSRIVAYTVKKEQDHLLEPDYVQFRKIWKLPSPTHHFTDMLSLTPHNNCCLKVSGLLESEPSDNTTMYVPLRYQTQKPNSKSTVFQIGK